MTQNLKSNTKVTHVFFIELWLASFTPKVQIIHGNGITFFLNAYFTLSLSSSSSIHNIVIAINTPTTMNNQFETLNAPKNRFTLFLSQLLWIKDNISLLSFYIYPKKTQDFDCKNLMVLRAIEAYYSCWVTFCLRFCVLGKDFCMLKKLSHWLELWN